jgi:hypothetical protein
VTSRAHGLVLAVLLGAASATGAYAVIETGHLGDAETKPEVASARQITARARKLDAWEVSLKKTLQSKPPALPPLNRYAAVTFVTTPGASTLPAPLPVARTGDHATTATTTAAGPAARPAAKKPTARPAAQPRPARSPEPEPKPVGNDDALESAAAVAAPAPTPVAAPVTTLSVEQQCRALLRAAEDKSEQVKQEAERQCEALKNAAEREKEGRG